MAIQEILVVDDDRDNLNLLRQILECEGMSVGCAVSAEDALAKLTDRTYSLMLTDLNMPGLNGIALARRASVIAPHMPVFLMTGDISPDTPQMAKEAGIAVVLNKPFYPAQLLQVIREQCLQQSPVPEQLPC